MNALAQQHCVPYSGGSVLVGKELAELHSYAPRWHVINCEESCTLERDFTFPNFAEALAFTDRVGALAKSELHFPEVTTQWGQVHVRWWTPTVKGLHRNDFIMAAKTDELYEGQQHEAASVSTPQTSPTSTPSHQ